MVGGRPKERGEVGRSSAGVGGGWEENGEMHIFKIPSIRTWNYQWINTKKEKEWSDCFKTTNPITSH